MHIAAASPLALTRRASTRRDRARARDRDGKGCRERQAADIIAKMVEGAIAKFRKENALLSQLFVMDGKTKIADVVAKAAKEAGGAIALKDYVRFQLGEGIEKEESDFAAEVAAASPACRER
jgi:elongation factor Ts